MHIQRRQFPCDRVENLTRQGFTPLMARILAARGVSDRADMPEKLGELLPYHGLKNIEAMAVCLADAIRDRRRILIVADYDCDGATACAVGVRGLSAMGADISFLVPNRFEDGYGLSPGVVRQAAERKPDIILTVDNGIASVAGVNEAKKLEIECLVTDHHLPGDELPDCLIVNPNQPGCPFPSKNLAGVGVMFYVLLALRSEQRRRGLYDNVPPPNLGEMLDIVALGTVADVVRLDDPNNRLLVLAGLARMRKGTACPGIQALFSVSGRQPGKATVYDLGFMLGPRINAAGRLKDMSVGIRCLLADSQAEALQLANELDRLNRERKSIEAEMQEQAAGLLDAINIEAGKSITLFDPGWHQGVVGLLASRIKERHHRPTIVFADGGEGLIKGSGRSIPGLHLRDALDLVDKSCPGVIVKFGGHAMAAGLTIHGEHLGLFREAFERVCDRFLTPSDLDQILETDGELAATDVTLDNAFMIRDAVWGQGFPPPQFEGVFNIHDQGLVGGKHLKMRLGGDGWAADAILFNRDAPLPSPARMVYRLDVNEWRGNAKVQLMIEHAEGAECSGGPKPMPLFN